MSDFEAEAQAIAERVASMYCISGAEAGCIAYVKAALLADRDALLARAITAEENDKISRDFLAVEEGSRKAAEARLAALDSADYDGLRPCPFCGGDAEKLELEDESNIGGSVICCKSCGASSPVHFDRKEHLVSSWNERALTAERLAAGEREERTRTALAEARGYIGSTARHSDTTPDGLLARIDAALSQPARAQEDNNAP